MTIRKEKDIEDFIYTINRKWQLSIEEKGVLESLLYTFLRGEDLKQIHNALNDDYELFLDNIPERDLKRYIESKFDYIDAFDKDDLADALDDLNFNWAKMVDIKDHIYAIEREGYVVLENGENFIDKVDVIDYNLFTEISEKFNKADTFERQKMRDLIVNL